MPVVDSSLELTSVNVERARQARSEILGFPVLLLMIVNAVWAYGEARRVSGFTQTDPPDYFFLVFSWVGDAVCFALGCAVLWMSSGRVLRPKERGGVAKASVYAAAAAATTAVTAFVWTMWFFP
jgi:hypothetical protein